MNARQVGEELFEFLFAGEFLGHGLERTDVATQPKEVGFLGGESFVLSANDAAGFFKGLADVHNWAEVYPGRADTGCPGQKKGKTRIFCLDHRTRRGMVLMCGVDNEQLAKRDQCGSRTKNKRTSFRR